jgi:nitrite reductase/ring-hydroxylating ferredoxin subunit
MGLHVVARVVELPPGARRIMQVEGRSIGVFNVDGSFHAVRNTCPHQGAPLCRGSVGGTAAPTRPGEYAWSGERGVLRCPWHGWEFDLATGRSLFDPAGTRVRCYPLVVRDGLVMLEV